MYCMQCLYTEGQPWKGFLMSYKWRCISSAVQNRQDSVISPKFATSTNESNVVVKTLIGKMHLLTIHIRLQQQHAYRKKLMVTHSTSCKINLTIIERLLISGLGFQPHMLGSKHIAHTQTSWYNGNTKNEVMRSEAAASTDTMNKVKYVPSIKCFFENTKNQIILTKWVNG